MTTYAKIQTGAVLFVPVNPAGLPAGAMCLDQAAQEAPSFVGTTGPAAPTNQCFKLKQNNTGVQISKGKPVSLTADGSVVQSDSDTVGKKNWAGVAMEDIAASATGTVLLVGPNIAGALTGSGFAPGDMVFISEASGYTNTLASFTGSDDDIIQVGIADCAAGAASATVADLIMVRNIISQAQ